MRIGDSPSWAIPERAAYRARALTPTPMFLKPQIRFATPAINAAIARNAGWRNRQPLKLAPYQRPTTASSPWAEKGEHDGTGMALAARG